MEKEILGRTIHKRTVTIFLVLGVFVFLSITTIGTYMYYRTVISLHCHDSDSDTFISCAAHVAVENNNARYCWAAGGFVGPETGICQTDFSELTPNAGACKTLFKRKMEQECITRLTAPGGQDTTTESEQLPSEAPSQVENTETIL